MKNLPLLIVCIFLMNTLYANSTAPEVEPKQDLILMKEGQLYEGKLYNIKSCYVHFAIKNKLYRIPSEEIEWIRPKQSKQTKWLKHKDVSGNTKCLKAITGPIDLNHYEGKLNNGERLADHLDTKKMRTRTIGIVVAIAISASLFLGSLLRLN